MKSKLRHKKTLSNCQMGSKVIVTSHPKTMSAKTVRQHSDLSQAKPPVLPPPQQTLHQSKSDGAVTQRDVCIDMEQPAVSSNDQTVSDDNAQQNQQNTTSTVNNEDNKNNSNSQSNVASNNKGNAARPGTAARVTDKNKDTSGSTSPTGNSSGEASTPSTTSSEAEKMTPQDDMSPVEAITPSGNNGNIEEDSSKKMDDDQIAAAAATSDESKAHNNASKVPGKAVRQQQNNGGRSLIKPNPIKLANKPAAAAAAAAAAGAAAPNTKQQPTSASSNQPPSNNASNKSVEDEKRRGSIPAKKPDVDQRRNSIPLTQAGSVSRNNDDDDLKIKPPAEDQCRTRSGSIVAQPQSLSVKPAEKTSNDNQENAQNSGDNTSKSTATANNAKTDNNNAQDNKGDAKDANAKDTSSINKREGGTKEKTSIGVHFSESEKPGDSQPRTASASLPTSDAKKAAADEKGKNKLQKQNQASFKKKADKKKVPEAWAEPEKPSFIKKLLTPKGSQGPQETSSDSEVFSKSTKEPPGHGGAGKGPASKKMKTQEEPASLHKANKSLHPPQVSDDIQMEDVTDDTPKNGPLPGQPDASKTPDDANNPEVSFQTDQRNNQ
jgi:bifunctional autolysin